MTNPILRALFTGVIKVLAAVVMFVGFYFALTRGANLGAWAFSEVLPLAFAQLLGMLLLMLGSVVLGIVILELVPTRQRRRKKAPRRRS